MSDRSEAEGGLGVTSLPVEPDTEEQETDEEPRFFQDPKRLAFTAGSVIVLIAAIYFLFPAIVGVDDGLAKLDDGDPVWIALAVAFCVVMFLAQIAMFKGVVGGDVLKLSWKESYQINMASLAASRLFSAGGAGGLILTYWALRKAGMPRQQSAARMVAFLVVMYTVYLLALVLGGVLLSTGVLAGANPPGLTIVPAAIAGAVLALVLLAALVPGDLQRRLARSTSDTWYGRLSVRLATVPATVSTSTRMALEIIKTPRRRLAHDRWSGRLLGGEHRDHVGELRGLRPRRVGRRRRTGVLRRHGREPDPRSARRGRRRRCGDDRHLRPLRAR